MLLTGTESDKTIRWFPAKTIHIVINSTKEPSVIRLSQFPPYKLHVSQSALLETSKWKSPDSDRCPCRIVAQWQRGRIVEGKTQSMVRASKKQEKSISEKHIKSR